jgi:hypothetical protein
MGASSTGTTSPARGISVTIDDGTCDYLIYPRAGRFTLPRVLTVRATFACGREMVAEE